ncbi:MAG TPA: type II toxin-antitoxin system mRNA interferase toxin, RelE/StbE family [Candidatus Kapabacteria bacterium]|nr:type II toxin-antitoxin system mRNA interferase toxin, RelE/StbE family [Candidatus Kapabacteria bacterium]
MSNYKILFHPEAKRDFDKLDGSERKVILKQLIKLQDNPILGEKLGNKAGYDLTGYRKMYAYKKKIRIVYRIHEGKLLIFIIAVGKREDLSVYQKAFERLKGS